MKKIPVKSSGFSVLGIHLIESSFKRNIDIKFDNEVISPKLDVNISYQYNDIEKVISVVLNTQLGMFSEGNKNEEVSIKISMVGLFQESEETSIKDMESFAKINGAAIIFPFVRSHISDLALKSGLGELYLPIINFSAKHNSKKESIEK